MSELVTLSYPHLYDRDRKSLVYVTQTAGLTHGSSMILKFEKRNGVWILLGGIELLIS